MMYTRNKNFFIWTKSNRLANNSFHPSATPPSVSPFQFSVLRFLSYSPHLGQHPPLLPILLILYVNTSPPSSYPPCSLSFYFKVAYSPYIKNLSLREQVGLLCNNDIYCQHLHCVDGMKNSRTKKNQILNLKKKKKKNAATT